MKISDLNDKKKSIDTSVLNKYKRDYERAGVENGSMSDSSLKKKGENYFYKNHDGSFVFDEYNDKKEKIKETKITPDEKIEVTEKIDDYFTYNETYFRSGSIASKSISSKLGFLVGMRYIYDEQGNVVEAIDTDKGYDFTFEDILKFCRDKKIDFETHSFPVKIYKSTSPTDNVKIWVIEYPDEDIKKMITYVIHGLTGTVLHKIEKDWPIFEHNS